MQYLLQVFAIFLKSIATICNRPPTFKSVEHIPVLNTALMFQRVGKLNNV